MSQDQWITLCFKVVEVSALVTIAGFIACYSAWAPWWRDPVGRTIVVKDALLIIVFIPSVLAIFLHFGRFSSRIAAWSDMAMLGLIAPVMIWRVLVFRKIHRDGKPPREPDGADPPEGDVN